MRYRRINHIHLDSHRHAKVWKLADQLARLLDHSIIDTILDVLMEALPAKIKSVNKPSD